MSWTQEDLQRWQTNQGLAATPPGIRPKASVSLPPAIGRISKPQMNKTEASYAAHLDILKDARLVLWWGFEAAKVRLGADCFMSPDFLVMMPDGALEFHDTKGTKKMKTQSGKAYEKFYAEEDAIVKAKVLAANFVIPIYFCWKESNGEWNKKGL